MNFLQKAVAKQASDLKRIANTYAQHGASLYKKSLAAWFAPAYSADEDISDNLPLLRSRSRDLYMGTPIATGALKTIRTSVIGSGLRLKSLLVPNAKTLKITEEQAQDTAWRIEKEFELWASYCDSQGLLSWGELQSLALLSALMSGDCFCLLTNERDSHTPYAMKLRLLEGDYVCDPVPYDGAKNIVQGVEVSENGKLMAYWVCNYHPNSFIRSAEAGAYKWTRVEPFGRRTGRRKILHIRADYERPAQRRGLPLLAPVIESLKQLTRYTDAELMAAVIGSMFTVFIKTETPMAPIGQAPIIPPTVKPLPEQDYKLGAGTVLGLGKNESIEVANPARPNSQFMPFVEAMCSQIGAALELPPELLLKTFNASYSASRGAIMEAWRMFRMRRDWLVHSFCQPIYETFLAEAVALERVKCPGFFDDPLLRKLWCNATWTGPAQGQLNPLDEANAAAIRVENGFSTRAREAAEISGMDYEALSLVRQREEALLPLPRIMDPGATANYTEENGERATPVSYPINSQKGANNQGMEGEK